MATKAPAKSKTALAVVKTTLPANIQQQYEEEIAAFAKRLAAPTGNTIKLTKQKTFKLPNGLEVDELEAVVVEFVAGNFWYGRTYDQNNIVPPDCFALGLEPAGLTPSENSLDKQCESCAGCWANQFKSAPNGRSKACNNNRLLALLPLDADESTQMWVIRVSPTGLNAFDGHVATVAQAFGAPVRAVVTKITFADNTDYQSLRFSVVERAPKALEALANAKKPAALKLLLTEPDMNRAAANDSAPARGAPARRAAPAKKVANARR